MDDAPDPLASLEAVHVAQGEGQIGLLAASLRSMTGQHVGLRVGEIAAHLDQRVRQEMGGGREAPDGIDDDTRELAGVHRVLAVFVYGVGVVDRAQELLVPPVDSPAVAQENLVNRLLVEQLLERGIAACGS